MEYVRAVGEAVHHAIAEVLGTPARDLRAATTFIFLQTTLLAGRDAAKKRAFYARVVELLKEKPGVRPEDVVINLMEDKPEDGSFGKGVGQYMAPAREVEIEQARLRRECPT